MHLTLILLSLGVLLTAQVNSQYTTALNVFELVHNLRDQTNNAIRNTFDKFGKLSDDVLNVSNQTKIDGTKNIQKHFNDLTAELNGRELSSDQKQCYLRRLALWQNGTGNSLQECINVQTLQALDYVLNASVKAVAIANTPILEDLKTLLGCETKGAECLDDLMTHVKREIPNVQKNLDASLANATNGLAAEEELITGCAKEGIQKAFDQIEEYFHNSHTCVD